MLKMFQGQGMDKFERCSPRSPSTSTSDSSPSPNRSRPPKKVLEPKTHLSTFTSLSPSSSPSRSKPRPSHKHHRSPLRHQGLLGVIHQNKLKSTSKTYLWNTRRGYHRGTQPLLTAPSPNMIRTTEHCIRGWEISHIFH
jgi:hypothetical protein